MQCPLCLDSALEPKYVGPTEVDICPKCRGIWLDRGELDRLLGDAPRRDDRDERRYDRDERRDDGDERRYDRDERSDRDERRYDRDVPFDRDERRGDRYDDRDARYGRDDDRSGKPRGKKSKAKRLADLFEEVLDL